MKNPSAEAQGHFNFLTGVGRDSLCRRIITFEFQSERQQERLVSRHFPDWPGCR